MQDTDPALVVSKPDLMDDWHESKCGHFLSKMAIETLVSLDSIPFLFSSLLATIKDGVIQ